VWRIKLCGPSLTRVIPERFRGKYRAHYKALYKCLVYFTLGYFTAETKQRKTIAKEDERQ